MQLNIGITANFIFIAKTVWRKKKFFVGAKRVFPSKIPAKRTKTHSPKNEPELKIEPQLKGSEKVYINVILKKIKKNQAEIEEILKSSENYVKEIMNYV